MKKQQDASLAGKKLSRSEMKNLAGGSSIGNVWVCEEDGQWGCYPTKVKCLIECQEYYHCRAYVDCP